MSHGLMPNEVAEFLAARVGVEFADGRKRLALDHGEGIGPAGKAGGGRRAGTGR